uniref:Calbindin n=1 Tax=Erpetoichthys calabaricus TaxID=27687 RepID=A0A8C4XGN4_ERPCA
MANAHLQGVEISATQFLDIWRHYDNDGNGYIEGKELQNFIEELQQARKQAGLELTEKMKAFVEEYGQNADGKIGIAELVQILPTEENFLLFFRQQLKSCTEFMQTWRRYDADHSGYIEAEELKSFLKDLLQKAKKSYDDKKLEEYTETTDGNGYMDENELDALLKDLCEKNQKVLDIKNISTYKNAIMALSDGGKLYRTELALVLCAEEN